VTLLPLVILAWLDGAAPDGPPTADTPQSTSQLESTLEALLDEPVVTTASQSAESASIAPAVSTTISAEDLRRYGIRSLDEAINYLSLGMITENPLHSVDIGARGVLLTADFGNHVLLLIDGHVVNEQWDGTAYFERGLALPLELVDHIEVVLGPGSVLYGSNAMLGVINVITRRAKDWAGGHVGVESELPTSLRAFAGGGHRFQLLGRRAELIAAADVNRQRGPSFTFGPQDYGNDAATGQPKKFSPQGDKAGVWGGRADRSYSTDVASAFLRMTVGQLELDARAARYQRATPYPNQFNQASVDFDDPDSFERDSWLSGDLRHQLGLGAIGTLRSRLYGDLYQYRQHLRSSAPEDCLDGQTGGCVREALGRSRWVGLEEQLVLDWRQDARLVTLVGVDGRLRRVESNLDIRDGVSGLEPGRMGVVDRRERALALYLQQTYLPASWLDLDAGARLDDDQRFGIHLSPRAAAAAHPWAGGTLKVLYAEAFRAPTAYELDYTDVSSQVAAPRLRPESVRSVEAIVEQRVGAHRLLVGVFRSWWKDVVSLETLSDAEVTAAKAAGELSDSTPGAFQYRNSARIANHGLNASFEGALRSARLRYGLNVTIASATRHTADGDLPLTVGPRVFGNAHASYRWTAPWPTLGLALLAQGRRPADRAFDGNFMPQPWAAAQLEGRVTLTGELPLLRGLAYRLTLDASSTARGPYVAGPIQAATPTQPSAELAPIDRLRAGLGLQYDF
jgi:outer membrane receptor for ferrienterochelin and colicins